MVSFDTPQRSLGGSRASNTSKMMLDYFLEQGKIHDSTCGDFLKV